MYDEVINTILHKLELNLHSTEVIYMKRFLRKFILDLSMNVMFLSMSVL